jgi:DNA-directed RNA polymerase specialized sigma24 family protein
MPELDSTSLQKVLHALLLIQLESIDEANRFSILMRSGWTNAEIGTALGISEGAVAVRRTRMKQKSQKEKE